MEYGICTEYSVLLLFYPVLPTDQVALAILFHPPLQKQAHYHRSAKMVSQAISPGAHVGDPTCRHKLRSGLFSVSPACSEGRRASSGPHSGPTMDIMTKFRSRAHLRIRKMRTNSFQRCLVPRSIVSCCGLSIQIQDLECSTRLRNT